MSVQADCGWFCYWIFPRSAPQRASGLPSLKVSVPKEPLPLTNTGGPHAIFGNPNSGRVLRLCPLQKGSPQNRKSLIQ